MLALQQAQNSLTQQILCDIAGDRYERDAVPSLIKYLSSPSPGIRASAADALGKIGDIQAGPALLEHLLVEDQGSPVRHLLASAAGAVGYREGIPALIEALNDPDPILRGTAAWGLGIMCAVEAIDALRSARAKESERPRSYTQESMKESLDSLELVAKALSMPNRGKAIAMLLAAIEHDPWVIGLRTTSAAWGLGELRAEEAKRPLERLLVKYPKGFAAEHIRAALLQIGEAKASHT